MNKTKPLSSWNILVRQDTRMAGRRRGHMLSVEVMETADGLAMWGQG